MGIVLLLFTFRIFASGSFFMDNYQKYLTGKGPGGESESLGNWEPRASTMTKVSDGWIIKKKLVPFRTVYYKYTSEYEKGLIWEEFQGEREVKILYEVSQSQISPSLPESSTVWCQWNDSNIYVKIDTTTYRVREMLVIDNWAGKPPPPSDIILIPQDKSVKIKWRHPTKDFRKISDIEGYIIYRSTDNINFIALNSTSTLIKDTSYIDTSVINGVTYYYKLRTVDASYRFRRISCYSDFSPSYKTIPNVLLTVKFYLDLKGYGNPWNVYLKGDFTDWEVSKIKMEKATENIFQANVRIVSGSYIEYKYEVNGKDEPLDLRKIKIEDLRGDGIVEIFDRWGVPNYVSLLPSGIGWILAERDGSYCKLRWAVEPSKNFIYYNIYRSTGVEEPLFLSSTTTNSFTDRNLDKNITYYYYITTVSSSTGESALSSSLSFNYSLDTRTFLPEIALVNKKGAKNLSGNPYGDTGKIKLTWISPDTYNNQPSHLYFILYSTYPVEEDSDFYEYNLAGIKEAHYPGTVEEFVTENMGENCPGFFFYIFSIYDNFKKGIISNYRYSVAGIKILASNKSTVEKGTNNWGKSVSSGAVVKIEIDKFAFPLRDVNMRIINLKEILTDYSLKRYASKIYTANKKLLKYEKFMVLPENEFEKDAVDTINSESRIFLVDIFSKDRKITSSAIQNSIKIIIPYPENTSLEPKYFKIARLNEKGNFWQLIKDGENTVDIENKRVIAWTKNFSVFTILYVQPSKDLSNVVVYPNPYQPYDGKDETGTPESGITFSNLTENAKIYIYNIAGEKVSYFDAYNTTGEYRWMPEGIASGLYIFLVEDETKSNEKFVGKLSIIR